MLPSAQQAGLGLVGQTKLITACSEPVRILTHARGSRAALRVEQVSQAGRDGWRGVRATFTDNGPGIADLEAAMADGFSTCGGWAWTCPAPSGWPMR